VFVANNYEFRITKPYHENINSFNCTVLVGKYQSLLDRLNDLVG